MTTDAQKRAGTKYDNANTVQIKMKLNIKTDADILAWFDRQETKQGAIKKLIREDIKKGR